MWTTQNRRRYDRSALRYPSDLTNDEWAYASRQSASCSGNFVIPLDVPGQTLRGLTHVATGTEHAGPVRRRMS